MKVFLGEFIHPDARELLAKNAEIVETFDDCESLDGMVIRIKEVNRDVLSRAKNLKVIGKHGIGCDSIDLDAAKEFGITVLNTPHANLNSVAELIIGLMLNLSRNISFADASCKKSEFTTISPKSTIGIELSGKTLGLVGMGNIALRTAEILSKGFGMKVLGFDPYISEEKATSLGYTKYESLKEMIAASDFVNTSVPLTPSTKNIISGDVFDAFKEDAVLINCARGGIVNEEDLYNALKNKKLRAAACDAFVTEPPTAENPLLSLTNFCATPHIGAATEEALYRMGMEVVSEVLKVLEGGTPSHRVV